jgi:hypothetical protein
MSAVSPDLPVPEGPGSVSGAPNLPEGFTGTFTSRYIDTPPACASTWSPAAGARRCYWCTAGRRPGMPGGW